MQQRDLLVAGESAANPALTAVPPSRFATPLNLALIIPLIVLLSGLGVGWFAWDAARQSARVQAGVALMELSLAKRDAAHLVLNGGDSVLDAMRLAMNAQPDLGDDATLIRTLLPIIRGRPGLALAHVSFPDGRWFAVSRQGEGRRIIRLRTGADGTRVRATQPLGPDGAPTGAETVDTKPFNPLERPFWRTAAAAGRRAWSDPYIFASSGLPGISLVEPIVGSDGRLAMVIAADFDLDSLGRSLSGPGDGAYATALFTADRTLLTIPKAWDDRTGSLFRADDLPSPVARAFFAALAAKGLPTVDSPPLPMSFTPSDGNEWGAAISALRLHDGPTWYLARIAGRDQLLGRSDAIMATGFPLALGVLGLGVGTGVWFALHLSRARREVERQRDRAHVAEEKVRALGSYQLTRLLGKGGMGEVWLGHHRLLARPAAIKLITAAYSGSNDSERREARARFDREARITASLCSRSTISLYDYGVAADGTWFYVMEMLDGMDLREMVTKHGPLPVGRIVQLLIQACGSLAEAHDRGLVHRDIKPDNLYACRLADEVDVLKVLDFGIVAERRAKEGSANLTRAGYIFGTPATMAPEQARGEELDGRSDLYALGCVAYWLATGTDVFTGDPYEVVANHLNREPEAPSIRAARSLPADFEALVLTCLAKDRESRPRDARALAKALFRIDVPDDQHWDNAKAQAWWSEKLPPRSESTAAPASP